jgi:pimeloyl-ACP methyl ester carboxylesterase
VKAYFISGLGADKRAFYKISLPSSYQAVYLDWIQPLKGETLAEYAVRFSKLIDNSQPFILVGLSFGGMLASELTKIVAPEKLIIISSLSNFNELPWYFRIAGKLRLQRIIPVALFKQLTLLNCLMSPRSQQEKTMISEYVKKTDPGFIRWSLDAILNWTNHERYPAAIHVHGGKDHLLPCRFVKADHVIPDGGHLMVLNKSNELNQLLTQIL